MLRIGVVGLGHLGKIHLKVLSELQEQYQIVGVYDSKEALTKTLAKQYHTKAFDSIQELIDQSDVVDVVTPTLTHFDIAKAALKQGKHLFIEKPITYTLLEAEKLLELSSEAGSVVQIGHVERFNPAFKTAQKFIEKPIFIEAHRLAQFNPRGTDVSVVLDLMIHDIDIILSVIKSPIKKISATAVKVISPTPDICNARLEFDNGACAILTASRISSKNTRKIRFFEPERYTLADFLHKKVKLFGLTDHPPKAASEMAWKIGTPGVNEKYVIRDTPNVMPSNAIQDEFLALFNSIIHKHPVMVSIQNGMECLRIAEEIHEKTLL